MKRNIFIFTILLGMPLTGCGASSEDRSSEPKKQSDTEVPSDTEAASLVGGPANNGGCKSELDEYFPDYSIRSRSNECWETVKTTESGKSFNGVRIDKGTPVLRLSSYAHTSPEEIPLGASFPDLLIGDEHNGDYSVSFDFCAGENGKMWFTMFDESTVKANDYLGDQTYCYCIDSNGAVSFDTTFGIGCIENIAAAKNYNADVWNNCVLSSADDKIKMYINGFFITDLPNPDPNKHGRLALSGAKGLTLKDFVFNE